MRLLVTSLTDRRQFTDRSRMCSCARIGISLILLVSATTAFIGDSGSRRHRLPSLRNKGPFDRCNIIVKAADVDIDLLSDLRRTSYDDLLRRIPPSVRIVLIGEGTHGTEEFVRIRSEVTQCLVQNQGFNAIVCEGDIQPFFMVNKFVTENQAPIGGALDQETLHADIRFMLCNLFSCRFPDWMWSNANFADFVSWLKLYNCDNPNPFPVHLLGMDIKSPFGSIDYIIEQLSRLGEESLSAVVKDLYTPLLEYRKNIRSYGSDVYGNRISSQEKAVKMALDAVQSMGVGDEPTWFQLVQNAQAIVASEAYHRQRIYPGHTSTWNLRTESMMDFLSRIIEYIDRMSSCSTAETLKEGQSPARLVVWAHNSHIGDMRSVGYASLGKIGLGQLCREQFGEDGVFLVGMTTYQGTVRAAHADRQGACWKGNGEVMKLKEAIPSSHESVLHSVATDTKSLCDELAFGMYLRGSKDLSVGYDKMISLNCDREERFVGSCYLPQTEMVSHYTRCSMNTQFDYIFHVDESSAIIV